MQTTIYSSKDNNTRDMLLVVVRYVCSPLFFCTKLGFFFILCLVFYVLPNAFLFFPCQLSTYIFILVLKAPIPSFLLLLLLLLLLPQVPFQHTKWCLGGVGRGRLNRNDGKLVRRSSMMVVQVKIHTKATTIPFFLP